jgi:hypothetical protein
VTISTLHAPSNRVLATALGDAHNHAAANSAESPATMTLRFILISRFGLHTWR